MSKSFRLACLLAVALAVYYGYVVRQQQLLVFIATTDGMLTEDNLGQMQQTGGRVEITLQVIADIDDHLERVNDTGPRFSWQFVVVAGGFVSEQGAQNFTNHLTHLSFIDQMQVFPAYKRIVVTKKVLNAYLLLKKFVFDMLGWSPVRPLQADQEADTTKNHLDSSGISVCASSRRANLVEPVVVVNVLREADSQQMALYNKVVVYELFPFIGTSVLEAGRPDSDQWDLYGLIEYPNLNALCEMAESRAWQSVLHHKQLGVGLSHTLLTSKVSKYS